MSSLRIATVVAAVATTLHSAQATAELLYVAEWGTYGFAAGQFNFPTGIAISPSGDIYVADGGNARVCRFTPDGQHIQSFGSLGSGPGMLRSPHHLQFSPVNGDLYVTDKFNHRIQRFTPDGTFVQAWGVFGTGPAQFDTPWGIHVDASGDVWVASREQQRIQRFTGGGAFLAEWGTDGTGPGQFRKPHSLLTDEAGNVYVSDVVRHDIQKLDGSGNYILQWGAPGSAPGEFLHPQDMTLVDGEIVVTDFLEHPHGGRLTSFTTSGVLTDVLVSSSYGTGPLQFDSISDAAYDGWGTWYVVDWGNHRIQKLRSSTVGLADGAWTGGAVPRMLGPPLPNPSSDRVRFELGVAANTRATYELDVFDVRGRRVLTRLLGPPLPRQLELDWDTTQGGRMPAGVYFVALRGEGLYEARRVVRVR